jgi:hypothetical protein
MKNCPKCGLANDVMRKYCRRCGAPLIQMEEETAPEPIVKPPEESTAPTLSVSHEEPLTRSADQPIAYEEQPLVRPSQVASEQVQTERVESKPDVMTTEPPFSEESSTEPMEEDTSDADTVDKEHGKEVVAEIVQRVRAAEARQKAQLGATPVEPDIQPPPVEPDIQPPPVQLETQPPQVEALEAVKPPAYEEPEPEIEPEVPVAVEKPAVAAKAPAPPITPKPSPKDEFASDEKVRSLEADINAYNLELQQLRPEFDTLRIHLDEEVEKYHNAAEAKRIRAESIQRDLDLAQKEYSDADKQHKNVENRRKKELSEAEKRIRDVEKRLKKAEESKEKRIQDIEKEQRKREEG